VVVYGLGDLASGNGVPGYSYRDQWISELMVFGIGVWRVADRRNLHCVGPLLIVAAVIGLPTHMVFAVSSRWKDGIGIRRKSTSANGIARVRGRDWRPMAEAGGQLTAEGVPTRPRGSESE
jgi:hypothetical protein